MDAQLAMEEDGRTDRVGMEGELLGELPRVRAFLTRLLRGRPELEVEDLVQETVARALRSRASYDRRRALGPWLRRTAFRVFLDQRGGAVRELPANGTAVEPVASPDERAGALERTEDVAHLLRGLARVEREVLLRFHRDEQPLAAIAAELGLPLGTVKSHLHRARRRLAEEGRDD